MTTVLQDRGAAQGAPPGLSAPRLPAVWAIAATALLSVPPGALSDELEIDYSPHPRRRGRLRTRVVVGGRKFAGETGMWSSTAQPWRASAPDLLLDDEPSDDARSMYRPPDTRSVIKAQIAMGRMSAPVVA